MSTAEDYLGEDNNLSRHMSQIYDKAKTIIEAHIEKQEAKLGSTRRY
eukprot:CAMPEP_0205827448 /NCGR_PEP_ID=MMETSP0206-20130828/32066_1 /ASSEMBLY_ACC=CAM_ASM_000279 /TAXON_ID=36767 /ORGANISM="Euplotes focardii, Strain TN1" /LENGTH=46 /DNA_ID= /DNA_START= /DNA_END= /DNA_ORIENTATION=